MPIQAQGLGANKNGKPYGASAAMCLSHISVRTPSRQVVELIPGLPACLLYTPREL